jgi:hypothetical protein
MHQYAQAHGHRIEYAGSPDPDPQFHRRTFQGLYPPVLKPGKGPISLPKSPQASVGKALPAPTMVHPILPCYASCHVFIVITRYTIGPINNA